MIQTRQDAPTDQPYAEITQTGRWTWDVTITYHFAALLPLPAELRRFTYGSWTVIGKRRAQRKAAKELRRYTTAKHRQANPIRIGGQA